MKDAPMMTELLPRPRPYWHVDAKWICGLMLLVFNLVVLTAEKSAVELLTLGLALMYSQNGLDDEAEVAEMRRRIEASPDKMISLSPACRLSSRRRTSPA